MYDVCTPVDETLNITTKSQLSSVVSLAIKSQSHCRLQAPRNTARPDDRAMRIILQEFSFMHGLDMIFIRNAVFVDFTEYSAAFLQSKLSVIDECLLTESTSKRLID